MKKLAFIIAVALMIFFVPAYLSGNDIYTNIIGIYEDHMLIAPTGRSLNEVFIGLILPEGKTLYIRDIKAIRWNSDQVGWLASSKAVSEPWNSACWRIPNTPSKDMGKLAAETYNGEFYFFDYNRWFIPAVFYINGNGMLVYNGYVPPTKTAPFIGAIIQLLLGD